MSNKFRLEKEKAIKKIKEGSQARVDQLKKTKLLFDDFEKIAQKTLDEENLNSIELDLSGTPSSLHNSPSLKVFQQNLNRSTIDLSDWVKFEELHLSSKKNIAETLKRPEFVSELGLNNSSKIKNDKILIKSTPSKDNIIETSQKDETESCEEIKKGKILEPTQNKNCKMSTILRNIIKLLPNFKGNYQDLPRFIRAIEYAFAAHPELDDEANTLTKENVLKYIIVNCLDDESYHKLKDKSIKNIAELNKLMKQTLLKSLEPENCLEMIYNCKQKEDESVETYAMRIRRLREKYDDTLENSASAESIVEIKKYSERLIVKSFIKGLVQYLRSVLLSNEFKTLEEVVEYAQRKEKELKYIKMENDFKKMEIQGTNPLFEPPKRVKQHYFNYYERKAINRSFFPRAQQNYSRFRDQDENLPQVFNSQYRQEQKPNVQDKLIENNQGEKINDSRNFQVNFNRQNPINRIGEQNHFPQTSNRKSDFQRPEHSRGNDRNKYNPNNFNSYAGLDKQERAPHRNPNCEDPTWNQGKSYMMNNKENKYKKN